MKLFEKIEKLELAVQRMRAVTDVYPDTDVIKQLESDYYCSDTVTQTSTEVEFLTPNYLITLLMPPASTKILWHE